MKPELLQAIDVLVAHAMKTAIADLWPHIKVLMDGVLLPALEDQKAAAQAEHPVSEEAPVEAKDVSSEEVKEEAE